jgi:hypothetical protein
VLLFQRVQRIVGRCTVESTVIAKASLPRRILVSSGAARQIAVTRCRLGVLGPLEVDGVSPHLPRQAQVVLATLLLRGNEVVSAQRLSDELWGGREPASAANAVQVYVSRIRKVLLASRAPVALRSEGPGYVLEVGPDDLDAFVGFGATPISSSSGRRSRSASSGHRSRPSRSRLSRSSSSTRARSRSPRSRLSSSRHSSSSRFRPASGSTACRGDRFASSATSDGRSF